MSADLAGFFLLFLVLGVLVIFLRASDRPGRTSPTDAFWIVCPRGAGAVQCSFVRDRATGFWSDVVRCSAFHEPCLVRCPKTCLQLVNLSLDGRGEGAEPAR